MADKKISALPVATTPLAGTEVLPIVQGGTTDQVSVANLTAGRAVSALSVTTTQDVISGRDVVITGSGTITQNSGTGGLYFVNSAVSAGATNMRFLTTNASGAAQTQFQLNGGATQVNQIYGDLIAETGNFKPGTAGKGIDFSANGGDVLTQYDEGTFTPSFTSSGATITHAQQRGIYTKVGRLVTVSVYIQVSSVTGTLTNPVTITGLPFATVTTPEYGFSAAVGVHQFTSLTPSMFMAANSTTILIYVSGTVTSVTAASLAAGYYLATINYMTS